MRDLKLIKKIVVILLSLAIILSLPSCYNNYKYKPGKDTIDIFGDGTFQILSGPSYNPLLNSETQENIEFNVYKYKEIKPFVYVIGESGYTILNYETGEYKKYKKVEEIPEKDKKIFLELEKE